MKSYTDLEQSKKLAEILPAESADMCWGIDDDTMQYDDKPYLNPYKNYTAKEYYIPCWSLAALLKVLPTIDDGNRNPVICKDIRLNKWHVVYHGTVVEPTIDSGVYDSLIDATVEMIVKLKERDLI